MPPPIKKLADKFLDNPKMIEVSRPASTNLNIKQFLVPVSGNAMKKREALRQLLGQDEVRNAIIFCNRKTTVRELNKSLKKHGFKAGEIHGDMEQAQRIAELDLFKDGKINILVASDVAARGLDIKGVSHVFNFDAPWHPDDYVHRIGRTGRGGATGIAYTLITSEDAENIQNIEKLTGQKIDRLDLGAAAEAETPAAAATAASEEPRRGRRDRTTRGESRRDRPARAPVAEAAPEVVEAPAAVEEPRRQPRQERRPEPEFAPPPRRDIRPDGGRRPRRDERDDGPDDGWNGPIPEFLKAVIGS
jgi:superfamily II DNA/RNA helicase